MKRFTHIFSLFCAIILIGLSANAQFSAVNTSLGLKGGILSARFAEQDNSQQALGFRVGGFLTYSIIREFGVGIEVNYARKGSKFDGVDENVALNYVEIPLLAQYFFEGDGFRPKVMVGPYYGYLLNAKQGDKELTNYAEQDYGFLAGVGLHKSLGGGKWLYLDARYTHGLAEIITGSGRTNRDVSLNVGISFPLQTD